MTDHLPQLAFIGKAGSGKDTAAELLIEHLGYKRVAFADKLKDVAADLWGADARKDRDKLQRLGEYVRRIDPDTWVDYAMLRITPDTSPTVVTDCRYHNEAWKLKGAGFMIVRIVADRTERINRLRTNGKLGPDGWEQHVSEVELDTWPEDYTVKNIGTKADLFDDLTRVIRLEQDAVSA